MTEKQDVKEDVQVEKQKVIQQKYVEYQAMEQQMKQIQQQLEKLEQQSAEANAVEQCIVEIGKTETGKDVLVPVTGGVFFRTKMDDCTTFLVNVGGGVVVEKDADGARKLIQQQAVEILKYKQQLTYQLDEQTPRFYALEQELKKLIEN